MPDDYEIKHGLNPHNAADASLPAKKGGGYTNIEVYLNSLVPLGAVVPLMQRINYLKVIWYPEKKIGRNGKLNPYFCHYYNIIGHCIR